MIVCKKCGKSYPDLTFLCPDCKSEIILSKKECTEIFARMRDAKRDKEYDQFYRICKRLADSRYIPAVCEWGALLESGELGEVKLDEAMRYFKMGAMLSDGYSAYRYSRLIGRQSDVDSDFWLLFSATLGTKEAAPAAARLLDECGECETASYYYTLCARCDNIDSIVTLAKRYAEGIGVPKSDEYARWYMDKLTLPPIHALGLAYRLRGAEAKEPPEPKGNTRELIIRLIHTARERGFDTARRRLTKMLADSGDAHAAGQLGVMYAEAIGGERDIINAALMLEYAAKNGDGAACKVLGDYHLSGKLGAASAEKALEYYRMAASLGQTSAYQLMGDVYYEGDAVERNIARAAELYKLAAYGGDTDAAKKYSAIIARREELYSRAKEATAEKRYSEAFSLFSLAAAWGHTPSLLAVARAYLVGEGTDVNRQQAFRMLSDAVAQGIDDANFPLALCYGRGVGTALDYKQALRLLSRANALGDRRALPEAMRIRTALKNKLRQSAYSRAMHLFYMQKLAPAVAELEYASDEGHGRATYTLGAFYEFGFGVGCDKETAYRLYEKAKDEGFRDKRNSYKLKILKLSRGKK